MLSKVLPGQTKVELEKLKVESCIEVEFRIALVPLTRPDPTVLNVEFWFLLPEEGGGGVAARGTVVAVPVAVTPVSVPSISARDLLVGSYSTKGK